MKRYLPALAGLLLLGPGPAEAEKFVVRPGQDNNRVVFTSSAPMETFDGKTGKVSGFVEFDPAALGDSVTFEMEVDLASLDTGISLRNKHMRENHLHTDKFPKAVFRGGRVSEASGTALTPGGKLTFTLAGTFELHGVTRGLTVPVEVTRRKDGALSIVSRFPVALPDYDIPRPKFLVMKLDEVQQVAVTLTAVSQP